jgi:hypothetical protein
MISVKVNLYILEAGGSFSVRGSFFLGGGGDRQKRSLLKVATLHKGSCGKGYCKCGNHARPAEGVILHLGVNPAYE